eukprot:617536-Prymnesium_polylepis.1
MVAKSPVACESGDRRRRHLVERFVRRLNRSECGSVSGSATPDPGKRDAAAADPGDAWILGYFSDTSLV